MVWTVQGPRRVVETRADESPQLWRQFQSHPQQGTAILTPSTPQSPEHPRSDWGRWGKKGREERITATYGLCQLCSQLCIMHLAPLDTVLGTGRLLAAHSPKRES